MSDVMLISDAAKEVNVENHVLRYWEEELHLPIKRNELGHRYYTKEDVERFKQIKSMKERGLQLKAIKMILKNGKIDILSEPQGGREEEEQKTSQSTDRDADRANAKNTDRNADRANAKSIDRDADRANAKSTVQNADREGVQGMEQNTERSIAGEPCEESEGMAIHIVDSREIRKTDRKGFEGNTAVIPESREDKSRRLQWLLQQLIRETLQENNQQLCSEIKDSVVKELDYQFRLQEEHEEERNRKQMERSEEYYKKMDELLRKKGEKKKRHFFF